jgi:hypothetical protein
MGSISLGEMVSDIELAEEESHAWTFSGGPAFIDVVLETSEELDGVLEIYDANNLFMAASDNGLTGEPETLTGIEIEDNGDYTIVVRGFYGAAGTYSLSVTEGEDDGGETAVIQSIFLFIDDNGDPIGGENFNSLETFQSLLQPDYDVTTWVSSLDGSLDLDTLEAHDLIIWDSGNYINPEGFFDEDTITIFTSLENGGSIMATGSAPSIFGEIPLSTLADVVLTGDDPILLENLNSGDTFELAQPYQAIISDDYIDSFEPNTISFLVRGPASEDEDTIAAFAVKDEEFDQKTLFLLFPFDGLPNEIEPIFMENILNWFRSG